MSLHLALRGEGTSNSRAGLEPRSLWSTEAGPWVSYPQPGGLRGWLGVIRVCPEGTVRDLSWKGQPLTRALSVDL